MNRYRRFAVLFLLVAVNVAVSLACGSGGGGAGDDTPTPSTRTPSWTPTPPPSSTPPAQFSLSDFLGQWKINAFALAYGAKIDRDDGNIELYFIIDEFGDVMPEPDMFPIFPKVAGGSFSFDNVNTGEYEGTVVLALNDSIPPTTIDVELSGTMAMDRETMSYESGVNSGTALRIEPNPIFAGMYTADVLRDMAPAQELIPFVVEVLDFDEDGTFIFQTAWRDVGEWYVLREEFVYGKMTQTDSETSDVEGEIQFLLQEVRMVRKTDAAPSQHRLEGQFEYTSLSALADDTDFEGFIQAYLLDEAGGNFSRSELNHMWNLQIKDDDGYMDQVGGFTINASGIPSHAELPIIGGTVDIFDETTGAFQMTINFSDEGGWTGQFKGFLSGSGTWLYTEEYDDDEGEWVYSGQILFFRADVIWGQSILEGYWSIAVTAPYAGEEMLIDGVLNVKMEDNGNGSYNVIASAPEDDYSGTAFAIGSNQLSIMLRVELPNYTSTPFNGGEVVFWVVFTADAFTRVVEYASFMVFDSSSDSSYFSACVVAPYIPPADITDWYDEFDGIYLADSPYSALGNATFSWNAVSETMTVSFSKLGAWGANMPVNFYQGDTGLLAFSIDASQLGYSFAENIIGGMNYHFVPPVIANLIGGNLFSNNVTIAGKELVIQ
ncbi:MAG: hypothetical protein U5N86_04050 [Planctomycetota bacterium]|nr:hypothetical protein [Planctomycetota bacterium]